MTRVQLREAVMQSTICQRLYVDYETVNPDVITPSEVDELISTIWEMYEASIVRNVDKN